MFMPRNSDQIRIPFLNNQYFMESLGPVVFSTVAPFFLRKGVEKNVMVFSSPGKNMYTP